MKTPSSVAASVLFILPLIAGCGGSGGGGGGGAIPSDIGGTGGGPNPPPTPAELTVAEAGGAYADVLVDCATAEIPTDSCTLMELPLIGQTTGTPTIDDVMSRTVISHAWMGPRFREFLGVTPPEILSLMKGVTAVVISSEVNPSFFSIMSGAIFVDPYFLWLTNAEKANVSRDPDYRAGFSSDLTFVSLWRYVKNNDYAWEYFDLNGTDTRTLDDIDEQLVSLLLHELAHANDAFPPQEIGNLNVTMSAHDAMASMEDRNISAQLDASMPLNSQMWLDLAEVMYKGEIATPAQRALNAAQVGLELESDGASDDYGYAGRYEDLAMLFEEVMMHHFYGIHREIAYSNRPPVGDEQYCDAYIVRWGARNRIGNALVKARAEMGLQLLLDSSDVSAYLNPLPTQWRMVNGRDWCRIQNRGTAALSRADGNAHVLSNGDAPRTPLRPTDRGTRYR